MAVESHNKNSANFLRGLAKVKRNSPNSSAAGFGMTPRYANSLKALHPDFQWALRWSLKDMVIPCVSSVAVSPASNAPDDVSPDWIVLDGQQRLTTLYQVFMCKKTVETRLDTNRDKTIFPVLLPRHSEMP